MTVLLSSCSWFLQARIELIESEHSKRRDFNILLLKSWVWDECTAVKLANTFMAPSLANFVLFAPSQSKISTMIVSNSSYSTYWSFRILYVTKSIRVCDCVIWYSLWTCNWSWSLVIIANGTNCVGKFLREASLLLGLRM
jgi:hypothetical protein